MSTEAIPPEIRKEALRWGTAIKHLQATIDGRESVAQLFEDQGVAQDPLIAAVQVVGDNIGEAMQMEPEKLSTALLFGMAMWIVFKEQE